MFDPLELVNGYIQRCTVPAKQVVSEVDWSNMNAAMFQLNFDMISMSEFIALDRAEAVRLYYEGKLLMFKSSS